MCGIAGYCLNTPIHPSPGQLEYLLKTIRQRGPDDEGACLISREQNTYQSDLHSNLKHDVAFLHTRYAIIDLSEKGHQPFISRDGSVIAIFNGEIYNYIELKKELSSLGVTFHTQCDTEVLVEGYARWKDELWAKMNGFWAVVLYDRRNQSVVFSRDRVGVAPLYYRQTSQGLFFSSYIETLLTIDGQKATPNDDVVLGFLQTGFKDIEQETFYNEIKTVPAGTTVHLSRSQSTISEGEHRPFWFLPDSRLNEGDISFDEAVKKFRHLLFDAVELRLRADVKVAFELSGGLDSSAIVAAAASISKEKITTYTVKIKDADEEPYARSIQQKYNIDYHIISEIEEHFAQDYGSFATLMEEPYDNPNAYTHFQMLKTMRAQGVKVVMTGAGGDEVLSGYESSFWPKAYQEWQKEGFESLLRADWYEFCRRFKTLKSTRQTLKHYVMDPWKRRTKQSTSTMSTAFKYRQQYDRLSVNEQRRFHFKVALLPYYMRSSDHFTMGIPIEHRFPLLDYKLVEFGMQLPISYLFRNGWTKYILRKAMEPYLPSKIIWRRQKMGFQFPYHPYLKTYRQQFEPILKRFYADQDYAQMLRNDPVALWRFLSTSIWMEQYHHGGHL